MPLTSENNGISPVSLWKSVTFSCVTGYGSLEWSKKRKRVKIGPRAQCKDYKRKKKHNSKRDRFYIKEEKEELKLPLDTEW